VKNNKTEFVTKTNSPLRKKEKGQVFKLTVKKQREELK